MKKVRSFIPCHFIIFGERSNPPRICESQTSKISVPDLELADCAHVLKIQNGGHKTLNRCEGSLCLSVKLTIGSCFSVHYRVMEHAESLESTKEA